MSEVVRDYVRFPLVSNGTHETFVFLLDLTESDFSNASESDPMHLQHDPIHTRAWTFQEHVLPPRLLIWSQFRLLWLCTNNSKTEIGSDRFGVMPRRHVPYLPGWNSRSDHAQAPLADLHELLSGRNPEWNGYCNFECAPDPVREEIRTHWEQVMVEYSKRKLSFKADKLPALSGLVSRFQHFAKDDYLAGHWKRWLLIHLLWKCVNL